jgi:hypothetical protein
MFFCTKGKGEKLEVLHEAAVCRCLGDIVWLVGRAIYVDLSDSGVLPLCTVRHNPRGRGKNG